MQTGSNSHTNTTTYGNSYKVSDFYYNHIANNAYICENINLKT